VTVDGGDQPVWSSDGKRIYYLDGSRLMVIPINLSPQLEIGDSRMIFENVFLTKENLQSYSTHYDVSPDEKYFVMLQGGEKIQTSRYNFILNWSQEVERRLKEPK
jgi:Tol biopolymer transport system component